MLTNCLAACTHLTITVSEIEWDICEKKSSFYHTPLAFYAPVRGVPVGISAPALVQKKLEWCRYPTVKKFRRYVYSFWRDPRTWQTDRQTLHHSKDRAYASHRAVKIILLFCSVLVPSIDRYRTNTVPWLGVGKCVRFMNEKQIAKSLQIVHGHSKLHLRVGCI